jgi:hypothetical protein
MRAREFITESRREKLPPGTRDPMAYAYFLPGIRNNDAYRTYRLGIAIARARAEHSQDTDHWQPFEPESVFAENSVIAGAESDPADIINRALEMTGYGGGMVAVGSKQSHEPAAVNEKSPVVGFKGYGR